jgi:Flp pilus assembly protein TadG
MTVGRPTGSRRAAAAVEVAASLLILLILMFAVVEFGRFIMVRHLVDNAAREGARVAVSGDSTLTTSDIQNVVTNALIGQPLQNVNVQVYEVDPATGANLGPWTSAGVGNSIAVSVSGTYQPILPGWNYLPNSVTLTATVVMQSEAN